MSMPDVMAAWGRTGWPVLRCAAPIVPMLSRSGWVIFSGWTGVWTNVGFGTQTLRPVTVMAHTPLACETAAEPEAGAETEAEAAVAPSASVPPASASVAARAAVRRCSAGLRGRSDWGTGSSRGDRGKKREPNAHMMAHIYINALVAESKRLYCGVLCRIMKFTFV